MMTAKKRSSTKHRRSLKPEEQAAVDKAREQRRTPRLKVENNKVAIDHEDLLTGYALMKEALGGNGPDFVFGLLDQLSKATYGGATIDPSGLNFMVSVIQGIEPRDQVEAMLAAQMSLSHMAIMKFSQHLPLTTSLPEQDSAERAINKFARTFIAQMETLKRYRSGGEQKVTVTHVSVGEGGQATAGNVTQGGQSPPLALTYSKDAPMQIMNKPVPAPAAIKRKSRK